MMNEDPKSDIIETLRQYGLKNPYRIKKLIEDAIRFNKLNLSDLIVFTEAASKNYVVTPIIAAMAGGKVYAITIDSPYGKAKDIGEFTYIFAEFCGVRNKIDVVFEKNRKFVEKANIVTNLGFVRPINKKFIEMMNDNTVISLMCEAWEYREGDIDLKECKLKNIPILATNEDAKGLDVFDYVGPLCIKMLFELEIEVYKSKIVVVSRDKFGRVIERYLKNIGAEVYLIENLKSKSNRIFLKNCDALVIADYTSTDTFIGDQYSQITAKELTNFSKKISVVQFTGDVDTCELDKHNITYLPNKRIGKFRMGMTFSELGPKPVIDLHCAGLKVGEIFSRAKINVGSIEKARKISIKNPLIQEIKQNNQLIKK